MSKKTTFEEQEDIPRMATAEETATLIEETKSAQRKSTRKSIAKQTTTQAAQVPTVAETGEREGAYRESSSVH